MGLWGCGVLHGPIADAVVCEMEVVALCGTWWLYHNVSWNGTVYDDMHTDAHLRIHLCRW